MLAFLLVPILVCGIIWINNDPKEYFKISTYQGWLVYLHAAKFGIIIVSVAYFLLEMILGTFTEWVVHSLGFNPEYKFSPIGVIAQLLVVSFPSTHGNEDVSQAYSSSAVLMAMTILSISFTYGLTKSLSAYWKRIDYKRYYLESFWRERKILDYFIFQSLENADLIQVTLSSRKCYVGLISKIQEPNEESTGHQHISLIPILSGYRDKDTLSLLFSNEYPKIPSKDVINYNDVVVFPVDEIVSVSGFDPKIYSETADNILNKVNESEGG